MNEPILREPMFGPPTNKGKRSKWSSPVKRPHSRPQNTQLPSGPLPSG